MWYVYILRCHDGTFYTGITTDITRRVHEHNNLQRGAKYSRVRRPVTLHYVESTDTRNKALKREHAIKKLSHVQKMLMVE